MISLDQILLLEQKVESAVEKIQQLEAENDALRNKCSELTNALSAKTEQLTSYESEQKKIETGIIKAIDRLNSIENSVLKAAGQNVEQAAPLEEAPAKIPPTEQAAPAPQTEPEKAQPQETAQVSQAAPEESLSFDNQDMNFDSMEPVEVEEEIAEEDSGEEPEATDELGFDIF